MKAIIVAMFGVLILSTSVFAAANDNTAAGTLTIGGSNLSAAAGGGPTNDLSIGLSPKVYARYVNTAGVSETTAQWYSIATVHPGGNIGYATAQDVNNIYMKAFTTGSQTTTITGAIQTAPPADQTGMTDLEKVEANKVLWTGLGWSTSTPTTN